MFLYVKIPFIGSIHTPCVNDERMGSGEEMAEAAVIPGTNHKLGAQAV
jgi:hypothetical protein